MRDGEIIEGCLERIAETLDPCSPTAFARELSRRVAAMDEEAFDHLAHDLDKGGAGDPGGVAGDRAALLRALGVSDA